MATNYNTMRFLTDEFNPSIRKALLVSNTPVNLTNFNRLVSITVQGNEPANTSRRFMFKMDNKTYKFSGQNLVEYTDTVSIDNVLSDGNSASQLQAVANNTQLVGKNIYPIIALYSDVDDVPTAKLTFNVATVQESLDYTKENNAKAFYSEDPSVINSITGTILGFDWDIDTNGNAQGGIKIKLLQNDTWSNYLTLTEALGQNATKYQTKYYYHVDAVDNNNSVKIKSFNVHWSPDTDFRVYGDTAYLTSIVKNFGIGLTGCVLVVRHESLEGGSLLAHCCFQKKRKSVSGEDLGYVSSGTYTTAHKFLPSTLKVFVNGNVAEQFTIFPDNQHFHVAESQWASSPYNVTCSYMYDADAETWLPMTADTPQLTVDGNLYTSRFYLDNPNDAKQLGAIRLTITRGRNTQSTTRVATGVEQRVVFSHTPDEVFCDADDWYSDYDVTTAQSSVYFTSTAGQTVNISYTWHGKTPVITGFTAGFTA